jgi:hypothetical protein
MANNIVTYQLGLDVLTDAVAGSLATAKVGLFVGTPSLGPTLDFATISATPYIPLFTGYAQITAVFVAPKKNAQGQYATRSILCAFAPSGGTPNDLIAGYYVSDGGSPQKLLAAAVFDTPIPINSLDSVCLVVAELLAPLLGWGGPNQIIL